jgi:hypothetical protein
MPGQIDLTSFHNDWIRLVDKAIFHYELLTEDERAWFNIQSLMQAVNDGGLVSYYFDHGADHLMETMADLKKLGADEVLGLLQQMNRLFPDELPPADIDERNNIIDTWDEDEVTDLLDKLDEMFFDSEDALENLLIKHILSRGLNITS